ncbi:MAG TPA: N-acetylmuramoyl-L-alanine amidase [Gemmatimonadaceae bacterium]|nr:N-acetylmuramoyl-L-alanine amidase [Gemmatimonadaceae bacterium]
MIALFLAAFQIAAAQPTPAARPDSLVVKDATRTAAVALVPGRGGPLLRADALRPIVPLTVSHLTGERWMLIVNGTAIQVEQGSRFVKVGDESYQLAADADVRGGKLYVPLQLLAEVVPRVASNLVWDAQRFELRAFSTPTRNAERRDSEVVKPAPRVAATPAKASRGTSTTTPRRGDVTLAGQPRRARQLVVVDAGHGGVDPGMRGPIYGGPKIVEKDVTLDVARRVGAALNRRGIDVKYTRTTDTLIALDDRGRIANEAHADLFVSIHVNAANPNWKDPGGARGFETYFLSEAKTEDARRVEQMENEVVKFETRTSGPSSDALSFVINDMAQNEHLREANELADLIQTRLAKIHPGPSRGVKQAGFRVLVTAFMPAVLVEIGFGSNPADAAFMTDRKHVDEMSAAIADAVVEYLKGYERRVSTSLVAPRTDVLAPR